MSGSWICKLTQSDVDINSIRFEDYDNGDTVMFATIKGMGIEQVVGEMNEYSTRHQKYRQVFATELLAGGDKYYSSLLEEVNLKKRIRGIEFQSADDIKAAIKETFIKSYEKLPVN